MLPRTLLLTGYTPKLDTGHGVRTYGVAAALARIGELEVAYRPFDGVEPAAAYAALPRTTLTNLGDSRGVARLLAYATARLRRVPDSWARGVTPELVAAAHEAPMDVQVVADGPSVAAALLGVARKRPIIYCAHNLESGFRHTIPGDTDDIAGLARFERKLLAAAAESWMVSQGDIEGALRLCPTARLRLVPNVVDVRAIDPIHPEPSSRRVLFVADLQYGPNRAGLEFLRDEVRPRLRALVPDAEIVVVGRGNRPGDDAEGLRTLGRVDDLGPQYAAAAVIAVPLLQGGGSPLKFVEALAHGLPIVATPKAAAGLDAQADLHYLEAEEGEQFAAQLARVLTAGAADMGACGRELALRRYSIEALTEVLHEPLPKTARPS